MDSVNRLEIYIPREAEVKNIPLWSLPSSVLRRMDLPSSDSRGSEKLSSSPEGIWIGPAVVRRKGQKQTSSSGKGLTENVSSLLGLDIRTPLRMSFVSSNQAAFRVLREIPGKDVVLHRPHGSWLPQGSAPGTSQTAVVVYRGCIYLCLRKNNGSSSDRSSPSFTSSSSLKSHKKELLNKNRPKKKLASCKEKSSESKKDVQSTDGECSVDSQRNTDVRAQQATQEPAAAAAAAPSPLWFQPVGGSSECEMPELDVESESRGHNGDTNVDGTETTQSSSRTEPLVRECEFDDLAQREMIAQMKAKLRQNEAALNNLHPAL